MNRIEKLKKLTQIKPESILKDRLKKMKEKNEELVIYILDDESKNNLCRHLNNIQMEADSYNIFYEKGTLPVFFINTEILNWILLNWKKSNGNKGFIYEKILHKEKNVKKWRELKI